MTPIVRAAVIAVLLALVLVQAPAPAKPPQSAERFVAAVERGRQALRAVGGDIDGGRYPGARVDVARCERALDGEMSDAAQARVEIQGAAVIWAALLHPYVELSLPVWRQVVADLDAVPTRDRALQAGRRAWRRGLRLFEAFQPPLEQPCEALERWRDTGFAADAAPISRSDARAFWRLLAQTDDERDRRYRPAVKRLRQLGISRRRANAFNGHRYFDLLSDDH